MKIKIYQIDKDKDKNNVKFVRHELLQKYQGTSEIESSLYKEVFSGDVECETLEDVYTAFNTEPQPLHRGHSLSVSDIVINDDGAYYCDSIGFKKVNFDESRTQKADNLLKVVYVEPHKSPKIAEIEHTLAGEQRAVQGMIEAVYCHDDDTCIICNENGKLIGMEGNRRYNGGKNIITGPFFVVGLTDDDFRSLTDEEVKKYMDRYAEIEEISQEETDNDIGFTIKPWQV